MRTLTLIAVRVKAETQAITIRTGLFVSSLPGDLETAKRGGFPRQRRRAKKATPYAAAAAAAVLLPSAAAVFSALRTSTNVALVGGEAVAVVVPKSRESGMKRKQKSLHYTNKHLKFFNFSVSGFITRYNTLH